MQIKNKICFYKMLFVVLGDMENIKLIHGDCLDVFDQINSLVSLVLCDPPYGTTQCSWDTIIPLDRMWKMIDSVSNESTPIVLFGAEPFSSMLRMSNIKNFKYDWVWDKVKGTGFLNARKQPMRNHEIVSVFYKKQCSYYPIKTNGHKNKVSYRSGNMNTDVYGKMNKDYKYESTERFPRSIQVFSTDTQNSSFHPTQKPVALLEYLIKTYTKEGDTVLDFCMGSGSTGVACINTNRNFIGIEKDSKYFSIAKKRIENHRKQQTLF
jgi:DNA modification methylase